MSGKVTHWTGCILGLIRYEATIGPEFVYCACIHCKHATEHYADRNGVWPPGALSSQALHAMRHKRARARKVHGVPPHFFFVSLSIKNRAAPGARDDYTHRSPTQICAL